MIPLALRGRPGADDPDAPFWGTVRRGARAGLLGYGVPHLLVASAVFVFYPFLLFAVPQIGLIRLLVLLLAGPLLGGAVGLIAVALSRALMPQAAPPAARFFFACLLAALGGLTYLHGEMLEAALLGYWGTSPHTSLVQYYAGAIADSQEAGPLFWVFSLLAAASALSSFRLGVWLTRRAPAPAPRALRALAALALGAYAVSSGVLFAGADHRAVHRLLGERLVRLASSGQQAAQEPEDAAALLRRGADPNSVRADGKSALSLALEHQDAETVVALLDHGARPDPKGDNSLNGTLVTAGQRRQTDLVRILLAHGASPNAIGSDAKRVLNEAAFQGELPIVKLLLQAGANVNAADTAGATSLMTTAGSEDQDDLPVVNLLLRAGADVNARDKQGRTALMYAAEAPGVDAARILLRAGADVNARTKAGATALTLARKEEASEVADQKTLRGKRAVQKQYAATLRLLQESGART